jgi:hypothetical protein
MKFNLKLISVVLTAFIAGIALGVSADVTITTTAPSNCFASLTVLEVDKLQGAAMDQLRACADFNTHFDASTLSTGDYERLGRLNESVIKVEETTREIFPCAQCAQSSDIYEK